MRSSLKVGVLALSFLASAGWAQQAPVATGIQASVPGKASMVQSVKASALVTAINSGTRAITLKGAQGRVFDLIAGEEVKNFDQIKVGDEVAVEYVRALTLELKKGGGPRGSTESSDAVRAKPGEKPGGAVGRQVTVMADVVAVNPKAKTITLKGPQGNLVELDVQNPDQFKVVKKGDQVQAVYTEALAIAVAPVEKKK